MIISEKQVMQLMAYATQLFHTIQYTHDYRIQISDLLREIELQQSTELREVK